MVYGYALAFSYTGKEEFINAAKQCAHYCISNLSINNWLPLSDFRAPAKPVKYDSGAGAIIACGLLEIADHSKEFEKPLYIEAAVNILKGIEENYANWDLDQDGILGGNSTMYHNDRLCGMPLIYGDYYFVEAILKLKNKAMRIW